jgi:sugar lactone lactonase YvrE
MNSKLRVGRFWLFAVICILCGCAHNSQRDVRLFWPIPPDGPRLEFVGRYKGVSDFPHTWFSRLLEQIGGEQGEPSVLEQPRGLFVDGEKILIADEQLGNVIAFNLKERSISALLGEGVLRAPLDITADRQGNFYIADAEFKKILVFSSEWAYIRSFASQETLRFPEHLAVNEKLGRIYVSDRDFHRIAVFGLSGELLFSFGTEGSGRGEFRRPQGLVFDREGKLFVADSGNGRIQIFDQDGIYLDQFGQRGNTIRDLREPVDLAFDSDGHLHILDKGMFAMLSYSSEGKVLLATGSGARSRARMGLANPSAINIDANDRIFISDVVNNSVSCWQYLNADYLADNPISKDDLVALAKYIAKTSADTVAVNEEDMHSALNFLKARAGQEVSIPEVK